jgi:hypothetical protein
MLMSALIDGDGMSRDELPELFEADPPLFG